MSFRIVLQTSWKTLVDIKKCQNLVSKEKCLESYTEHFIVLNYNLLFRNEILDSRLFANYLLKINLVNNYLIPRSWRAKTF